MSGNYFSELAKINVNDHIEKKGKFSYLSWAWAVDVLRKSDPTAVWEVMRFNGVPYMETSCGYFVEVAVTVQGITLSQIHPVLDNNNRPIAQPNAFQINTSIQRCLVKAIALHGLGLYVYSGEDLPEGDPDEIPPQQPSLSTLKAKYQLGKGSIDGFEQWVEDQRSKGRSEQDMNAILTKALEDKKSDQEALAEASRANMASTSKISDKQYGLFKSKAKAAGYSEADYNMISQGFEAATPKDIDKSKFNEVLQWMEKNPKGKGDPFADDGKPMDVDMSQLPF